METRYLHDVFVAILSIIIHLFSYFLFSCLLIYFYLTIISHDSFRYFLSQYCTLSSRYLTLIHSFIHLFLYTFIYSFFHIISSLFIYLLFTHSFIYLFIESFIFFSVFFRIMRLPLPPLQSTLQPECKRKINK